MVILAVEIAAAIYAAVNRSAVSSAFLHESSDDSSNMVSVRIRHQKIHGRISEGLRRKRYFQKCRPLLVGFVDQYGKSTLRDRVQSFF